MAENKAVWIDWPHDDCHECGGSIQVLTEYPQDDPNDPIVLSGDKWRCEDGHEGAMYCDSENPARPDPPTNVDAVRVAAGKARVRRDSQVAEAGKCPNGCGDLDPVAVIEPGRGARGCPKCGFSTVVWLPLSAAKVR